MPGVRCPSHTGIINQCSRSVIHVYCVPTLLEKDHVPVKSVSTRKKRSY
uniref:Uncharacterized protein n=1 Tax=Anguilla anguilla TaxID=7936 RepID=A0A0E9WWS7_ANGAN